MDSQTSFLSANLSPASSSDFLEIVPGSGNDTIFTPTEHSERTVYRGGLGIDRINLVFTSEQLQTILDGGQLPALKTYLSDPTNRRLELVSLLNFAAEGFEIAALYIQDASNPESGDRLVPISLEALLNTEAIVIEQPAAEVVVLRAIASTDDPPPLQLATLAESNETVATPSTLAVPEGLPEGKIAEKPTLVSAPNVSTLFIGMDRAYVIEASNGSDYIYAGDSDDLIYTGLIASEVPSPVPSTTDPAPLSVLTLATTNPAAVVPADIDRVWAGGGNDTIVLSSGADTIYGEEGDDLFLFNVPGYADGSALDGDTIYGGAGSDTIRNDTPGADIFLWQINNFYQFFTSTWIYDVEVFDGNGGTIIGRDNLTNYLDFSGFHSVVNVPFIQLGNNYDLADASKFTSSVEIHGLAGNDVIIGSANDDTIVGGLGNDTITGGAGRDWFYLNAPNEGIDYIPDFTPGIDTLLIAAKEYDNFQKPGSLIANHFAIGIAARTPNHRFIYNPVNGYLLYDADGAGNGLEAVQVAVLGPNLSLTHSDIRVV